MEPITYDFVVSCLNSGKERRAVNMDGSSELFFGVGETAYMYTDSALELLDQPEIDSLIDCGNDVFKHLPDSTLFHLLRRECYYLSDKE